MRLSFFEHVGGSNVNVCMKGLELPNIALSVLKQASSVKLLRLLSETNELILTCVGGSNE